LTCASRAVLLILRDSMANSDSILAVRKSSRSWQDIMVRCGGRMMVFVERACFENAECDGCEII